MAEESGNWKLFRLKSIEKKIEESQTPENNITQSHIHIMRTPE